jgi:antitoxin HicB
VARVPKTVHAQLATRARAEGVSLNALVLTFIAQGLGGSASKARACAGTAGGRAATR